MPRPECRLIWYSTGGHLQQLFTGLVMLQRRGLVALSQAMSREPLSSGPAHHLKDVSGAHLSVVLNGQIRIHYDCHDAIELHDERLEWCDFYFKRSYSCAYVDRLPRHAAKVLPLGLYYRVLPARIHMAALRRALVAGRTLGEKARSLLDALDVRNWLKYNPRLPDLEALPDYESAPKVLFLAAAHDPHASPGRSLQKIEEMTRINDQRAQCIRVLRKVLGSRFLGGFMHSAYAAKTYKDCLAQDNDVTRKRNYVRLLKSFPICVATTGLHGSIGGKFAEYVALAKAIVSEKLNFEVPGDLVPGRNYLEFGTAEQCAEHAVRLIEDRDARMSMMFNNALYYQAYLRPDSLVLNSLLRAQSLSCTPASAYRVHRAADITKLRCA